MDADDAFEEFYRTTRHRVVTVLTRSAATPGGPDADRRAADTGAIYGIWRDGVLVGGTMFVSFDARSGVCEVGCWLERSAEGRGLITRAIRHMIDWAFRERGMHRVEWVNAAHNVRSAAVAQRLGMRLDGVLRSAFPYRGQRHDNQVWSVLADEWPTDPTPV